MRGFRRVREVLAAYKSGTRVEPKPNEIEILILCRGAKNSVERNRIRRRVRAGLREIVQRRAMKSAVIVVKAGRDYLSMPWSKVLEKLERTI